MRTRTARPRPQVTPQAVVKAALEILDKEGTEGVTFRAVAQKLGVKAPALYWHFVNKRDLMDDLAQSILVGGGVDAVNRPSEPSDWRPWLAQCARTLRAALIAHRDGGRVVAGASFGRAKALARLTLLTSEALREAGFGLLEAGLATGVVIDYVWGFVIEEQEGEGPPPGPQLVAWEMGERNGGVDFIGEAFGVDPPVARFASDYIQEVKRHDDTELFEWGLQVILDGLARVKESGREANLPAARSELRRAATRGSPR